MLLLPGDIFALLNHFAPLFSRRTWRHVPVLVIGALLAPGRRMVSSALRTVGLAHVPTFQTYQRVLNRASWSSLGASRILLHMLLATFAAEGPLVLGIDETIERRRGKHIAAAGIYRDPVRSSHSHFVKVNGLRWVCLMLLVPMPWASRVWALPFLTALAPSERYAAQHHRQHKSVTVWTRQLIRLVHRWLPDRQLVVVGDRAYAALELLAAVRPVAPVATVVTRLRLDAHLCAPMPICAPRCPSVRLDAHLCASMPICAPRCPSVRPAAPTPPGAERPSSPGRHTPANPRAVARCYGDGVDVTHRPSLVQ
jgi:hypothetical protein